MSLSKLTMKHPFYLNFSFWLELVKFSKPDNLVWKDLFEFLVQQLPLKRKEVFKLIIASFVVLSL